LILIFAEEEWISLYWVILWK